MYHQPIEHVAFVRAYGHMRGGLIPRNIKYLTQTQSQVVVAEYLEALLDIRNMS